MKRPDTPAKGSITRRHARSTKKYGFFLFQHIQFSYTDLNNPSEMLDVPPTFVKQLVNQEDLKNPFKNWGAKGP